MKGSQKQNGPQLKMARLMSMKIWRKTPRKDSKNNNHNSEENHHAAATAPGTSKRRRSLPRSLRLNLRGRSGDQEAELRDDSTASTHSHSSSIDNHAAGIVFRASTEVVVSMHEDDVSIGSASFSDISQEVPVTPSTSTLATANNTIEGTITQTAGSSLDYEEHNNDDGANNDQSSNTVPSRVRSRRSTLDMLQNLNLQDALQQRLPRRASAPETTDTSEERISAPMFRPQSETISFQNRSGERPMFRGHSSERNLTRRQSDLVRNGRPTLRPFSSERNVSSRASPLVRQETSLMGSAVESSHAIGTLRTGMPPSFPVNDESAGNDHARAEAVEEMPLSGSSLLYHAVSSGAPPRVIQSIVDADPSSTGHQNSGGHTALHCGIERYDTPLEVIRILIEANPASARMKNCSGLTPVDLIWKRFVSPENYRSEAVKNTAARLRAHMENVVAHGVALDSKQPMPPSSKMSDQTADDCETVWKQQAKNALRADDEFRRFWDLMTLAIRAANQGTCTKPLPEEKGRWRIVHEAVIANCHPLFIRFAAALHPEQLRQQEEKYGRLPLHLAAVAGSPRLHGTRTITQSLLRLYPDAASCQDYAGRLPIILALENGQPWEGCIRELFMAWPQSLSTEDRATGLVPFMLSAVGQDSDISVVFSLLREGPLEIIR